MKSRWIIQIVLAAVMFGAAITPSYALDAKAFAQQVQKEKDERAKLN